MICPTYWEHVAYGAWTHDEYVSKYSYSLINAINAVIGYIEY